MCGRFTLATDISEIVEVFGADPQALDAAPSVHIARYNICPTQPVLAARLVDGERRLSALRWGFIPHWYKVEKSGPLLINARSETLHEKPAFAAACRSRRCLIPASGFFEWLREGGTKTPFFADPGEMIAFAGIWQDWRTPEGELLETCAIVTCAANQTLSRVHHRMPVTLPPDTWALWLGEEGKGAARLMVPAAEERYALREVGAAVNSNRVDRADLIEPI